MKIAFILRHKPLLARWTCFQNYCNAAISAHHEIIFIFFYGDGVYYLQELKNYAVANNLSGVTYALCQTSLIERKLDQLPIVEPWQVSHTDAFLQHSDRACKVITF